MVLPSLFGFDAPDATSLQVGYDDALRRAAWRFEARVARLISDPHTARRCVFARALLRVEGHVAARRISRAHVRNSVNARLVLHVGTSREEVCVWERGSASGIGSWWVGGAITAAVGLGGASRCARGLGRVSALLYSGRHFLVHVSIADTEEEGALQRSEQTAHTRL